MCSRQNSNRTAKINKFLFGILFFNDGINNYIMHGTINSMAHRYENVREWDLILSNKFLANDKSDTVQTT